jgi:hypothetical protein
MTSTTSQNSKRFSLDPEKTTRVILPPRLVLYGEVGIGKTTFGVSAKNPILIPTEEGAMGTECPRLPVDGICKTFDDVLEAVEVLIEGDHDYKTAVIDTITGAQTLCSNMVCKEQFDGNWAGDKSYGAYANGAKATAQEFRVLLEALEELWRERKMMIILLAHSGLMRSANALGDDFQKFAPSLERYTWEVLSAWADMIGHATRDVHVTEKRGGKFKARAIGSERYIFFEGEPGRDAKARAGFEIANRVLLSYEDFQAALDLDPCDALIDQILDLLPKMSDDDRAKTAKWCGTKTVTAAGLKKKGKAKLTVMLNRMMSKLENEEANAEPPAEETKKKGRRSRKKKTDEEPTGDSE